jgi:hypothetical protein
MKISINYEVDIEDKTVVVTLTAECYMKNDGIGSYEYMGSVEYDEGKDYFYIEEITWPKFLYTIRENNTIMIATDSDACYKAFKKAFNQEIENNF